MNPFVVIICFVVSCILFAPIHSTLCYENLPPGQSVRFRLSFLACCGFEWIRGEEHRSIQGFFLTRPFVRIKIKSKSRNRRSVNESVEPRKKKVPPSKKMCYLIRLAFRLPRIARRLSGMIRIRHFEVRGYLGLGDPAFTGCAFGFLDMAYPMMGQKISISVVPDFMRRRFEGRICLDFRFMLFFALWATAVFTIQAFRIYFQCKR